MNKNLIITILVLASVLLIYITLFAHDDINENCNSSSYSGIIYLSGYNEAEVVGSTIQALENQTGKIIDSTIITFGGGSEYYMLENTLTESTIWKIILNNGKFAKSPKILLITDIERVIAEEHSMFQKEHICIISKWKVNGIQYSIENGDHFIQSDDN